MQHSSPNYDLSLILDGHSWDRGDSPACVVDEMSYLSFRSAQQALLQHKEWLQTTIAGDRHDAVVAYMSSNTADYFLSVLACTSTHVSGLAALLNTRWTPQEMARVLEPSCDGCRVTDKEKTIILYTPDMTAKAKKLQSLLRHSNSCIPLPSFAEGLLSPMSHALHRSDATAFSFEETCREKIPISSSIDRDDAVIVFTSGTTSGSKGVRLSHGALYIQALAKLNEPCRYSRETILLATTVPFFHVGGLNSILAVWIAGGCLTLKSARHHLGPSSGFNPAETLRLLSSHGQSRGKAINTLVVVPAMLHALEQEQGGSSQTFPQIRLILVGGQSATPSTVAFIARTFPNARVVQTYACTEAASSLTFLEVRTRDEANEPSSHGVSGVSGDCVGTPPDHVELCLFVKDQVGQRLPLDTPGVSGVIATRGPHVMNGYWKRGVSPQGRLSSSEWIVTNDLGFQDVDGRFYFSGRASDSIRTGGETVMASEVERVLERHEAVRECAVFPLADAKFGEAVCCALVCRPGTSLSLNAARQWCEQQGLAGYKKPQRLFHVKELPRNASGKVLKFRLVERFGQHRQARCKL